MNCDLKARDHGRAPARSKAELKVKVIAHLRKLQKLPGRVMKYFQAERFGMQLVPGHAYLNAGLIISKLAFTIRDYGDLDKPAKTCPSRIDCHQDLGGSSLRPKRESMIDLASVSTAFSGSCLSAHSQTVMTLQPAASNCFLFRQSRSTLASNLACQNSGRVFGFEAYLQPACLCQKQPFTKTATA